MKKYVVMALFIGIVLCAVSVLAAESMRDLFIAEMYGTVMIKKAGAADFVPATKNMAVSLNDEIKTDKGAFCEIAFDKNLETVVSMKENSALTISKITVDAAMQKEETLIDLQAGSVLTKVKKLANEESQFKIKTPTSIVGVRGTNFEVKVVQ